MPPPIETLDWSPLFHSPNLDLVKQKVLSPLPLVELCMQEVLAQDDLLEEITVFLPSNLRNSMIGLCLSNCNTSPLTSLLYCLRGPSLALAQLLPSLTTDPFLLGDMVQQMRAQAIGYKAAVSILELVASRVISISSKNPKAIKVLDISGFPITRFKVETFLKTKFRPHEQLTIILDVIVTSRGDTGWVNILRGTQNINFIVKNVYVKGMREAQRNQLLHSVHQVNANISSLKLSSLAFSDWYEVRNTLEVISKFSKISSLELSNNNMFDQSPNDEAGRDYFNKFLRNCKKLKRLDLSHNFLRKRLQEVLSGINLTFLNVSGGDLAKEDLAFLFFSQPRLTHLIVSQNRQFGDYFESYSTHPFLNHLQILEVEDCSISSRSFAPFLRFLAQCPSLSVLDLSYNTLYSRELVELLEFSGGLRIIHVCSQLPCSCGGGNDQLLCVCDYPGREDVMEKLKERNFRTEPFDKEKIVRNSLFAERTIVFKAVRDP